MSRYLHRIEDFALVSALVAMLVTALVQILLRNFFDLGIFWAESFVRVLVLWVAMLGAMVATREANHISIDALSRYLPVLAARVTTTLTALLSAAICGTVAWFALEFVRFEYEDQTIQFGSVPSWVCQAILPFGFGVMSLRFLIIAVRRGMGL